MIEDPFERESAAAASDWRWTGRLALAPRRREEGRRRLLRGAATRPRAAAKRGEPGGIARESGRIGRRCEVLQLPWIVAKIVELPLAPSVFHVERVAGAQGREVGDVDEA